MGIENSVNLIGHLGKDPERASTQNGTLVATFNLAQGTPHGEPSVPFDDEIPL